MSEGGGFTRQAPADIFQARSIAHLAQRPMALFDGRGDANGALNQGFHRDFAHVQLSVWFERCFVGDWWKAKVRDVYSTPPRTRLVRRRWWFSSSPARAAACRRSCSSRCAVCGGERNGDGGSKDEGPQ